MINLSFTGRYALKGKIEQVNRAMTTIKAVKKDDVAFFNITNGENKIAIVATDEDKKQLEDKKADSCFFDDIRRISKDKTSRLANLFEHIFGSSENALLVQGDQLAKFALATSAIDYSTGFNKTKYQKVEFFVDGSSKKYNSKGRLTEIRHKDGTIEEIFVNGAKKITKPDGTVETTGAKIPSYARAESQKEKDEQTTKESSLIDDDGLASTQSVKTKGKSKKTMMSVPIAIPFPMLIPVNISKTMDLTPVEIPKQETLEPEIQELASEEKEAHPLDIIFERYKGQGGIIDYENETISLPYRDGIRQILNKDYTLCSFVFPDGTIKNYDKYENITEKIYPDGKIEFFNRNGRMYLTMFPDGTKEYSKLIV